MMSIPALDRKLLAILAADMVGYSKAMEADEAGTIKRLKAIRADLINPAISQRHGSVVKLMGDGALVAFDSVVDAVACAAEIQNTVAARNAGLPEPERIVFRIGINLGDVALVDGDVYGDECRRAARAVGQAGRRDGVGHGLRSSPGQTRLAARFRRRAAGQEHRPPGTDVPAETRRQTGAPPASWNDAALGQNGCGGYRDAGSGGRRGLVVLAARTFERQAVGGGAALQQLWRRRG